MRDNCNAEIRSAAWRACRNALFKYAAVQFAVGVVCWQSHRSVEDVVTDDKYMYMSVENGSTTTSIRMQIRKG